MMHDRDDTRRTQLVLATRNPHKVREISEILSGTGLTVLSFQDFPDLPEVEEDGETLKENAVKKAATIAAVTGLPSLAGDTGLEVDALRGRGRDVRRQQPEAPRRPRRRTALPAEGELSMRRGAGRAGRAHPLRRGEDRRRDPRKAARAGRIRVRSGLPARWPRPNVRGDGALREERGQPSREGRAGRCGAGSRGSGPQPGHGLGVDLSTHAPVRNILSLKHL